MNARRIFRPGKGAVAGLFSPFRVNGTAVYRGDFVVWDTTAPTSQGSSGVLDGQTLGTDDFIFCRTVDTVANGLGLGAGVVEGRSMGDRDSATALSDDGIAIVQVYGVHATVQTVDDTVAAGALLTAGTVAGAMADGASATDDMAVWAVALTADRQYTRGTVATMNAVVGLVRCI